MGNAEAAVCDLTYGKTVAGDDLLDMIAKGSGKATFGAGCAEVAELRNDVISWRPLANDGDAR